MDYLTIYEYTPEGTSLIHLIPLLFFTLIGFGLTFYLKKFFQTYSLIKQFFVFFGYLIGTVSSIMLIVSLVRLPERLKDERIVKEVINEKKYKIAEGKVENLSTRDESGHLYESFSVNGVRFEYSDFIISKGFHQTSQNNGPIRKEGQMVRISYITKDNENLILKLQIRDN